MLQAGNDVWDAKMKVLIDMVRHHVREEEDEYFKALKKELEQLELRQPGEAVESFKKSFEAAESRSVRTKPMTKSSNGPAAMLI
jgi:hypothetical protein